MTALAEFEKRYNEGQTIFNQLFALSDEELKKKITEIIGDDIDDHILKGKCRCTRTIVDGIPEKVEFCRYDGIEVTWQGISRVSEHGEQLLIRRFDSHFKL